MPGDFAGIISRYNANYFCTLTAFDLNATVEGLPAITVELVVRGDMSLGPLQRPSESRVVASAALPCPLLEEVIIAESPFEITARLAYSRPAGAVAPFQFAYGAAGYAFVILPEPEGDSSDEMAED
jgi:hypothetical protein